jgi:type IV secretion system protein VirB10
VTGDPDRALARRLRLRGDPPPVARLSRRAIVLGAGAASLALAAVLALSLRPHRPPKTLDPAPAPAAASPPEQLAALPRGYDALPPGVPRLGPPLPGDLGRPMLAGAGPAPYAGRTTGEDAAAAERRRARASPVSAPGVRAPERQEGSPAPVARAAAPKGPVLPAGLVLKAALGGAARSDAPGPVTAVLVEDAQAAATVLAPRGSRLLGTVQPAGGFAESRLRIVFDRLVRPDGRAASLGKAEALGADGGAGLPARADRHWLGVFGASLGSLALAAAGRLGADPGEGELARALRYGLADSGLAAGGRALDRSLQLKPSLAVEAGALVQVRLGEDLALEPAP